LVGDVVDVVVVVEFDNDGPDPLGAALASIAAPAMMRPAKQPAAKSLRIMITFHSGRTPRRSLHVVHVLERYLVRVTGAPAPPVAWRWAAFADDRPPLARARTRMAIYLA
jgi:hypothetical protein